MSTAKPLLPEIVLIMVTSLMAPYSSPLLGVPDRRYEASDRAPVD